MSIDSVVLEFIRNTRCSVHTDNLSKIEEARLKALFDDCLATVVSRHNEDQVPT